MPWNLAKGNAFLPDVSVKELEKLYHNEKKTKPKQRLLCALHRKEGASMDEIAAMMRMSRATVHNWLRRFELRGLGAKDSIKQSGKPPLLSLKERKRLIKDLERGPLHNPDGLWTTKEVRKLLETKYHVHFWPQHVWRILTALGFSLQKPRKRHYKSASDEEIEAFKKPRGGSQDDTEGAALLWARRMKPHSV